VTKKYKINITNLAQDDLEHIYYYIASDNKSKASQFILELEKKIYSLEVFPERNALIPENEFINSDYRHLIHGKYRIIYRIADSNVYILRIFHGTKLFE